MAHNNFYNLEILLKLIDDKRNDIYLHIDEKVKNFDIEKIKNIPMKSNIYIFSEISVNWGGYSQIQCELFLLEKSIEKKYKYYHLLSGSDLPLKSQNYIHKFFEINNGKEFIKIDSSEYTYEDKYILSRIPIYHLLQEYRKISKYKFINIIISALDKMLLELQKLIGINRVKKIKTIASGSSWFSITDKFANYIIANKDFIHKYFKFSSCADEMFIHTLLINSQYINDLYLNEKNESSNVRLIDFKRGNGKGNPYVFTIENYKELTNSESLFARKFDENIDKQIIDRIYLDIKGGDLDKGISIWN